jgi:hypothetical protein
LTYARQSVKSVGMTDATKRELLAERFGADIVPLELEESTSAGDRTRFVALMHALIGWFVAHPDVPLPWAVTFNVHVPDVEALEALAAELGTHTFGHGTGPGQLDYDITSPTGEGPMCWSHVTVAVKAADRPL